MPAIWLVVQDPELSSQQVQEMARSVPAFKGWGLGTRLSYNIIIVLDYMIIPSNLFSLHVSQLWVAISLWFISLLLPLCGLPHYTAESASSPTRAFPLVSGASLLSRLSWIWFPQCLLGCTVCPHQQGCWVALLLALLQRIYICMLIKIMFQLILFYWHGCIGGGGVGKFCCVSVITQRCGDLHNINTNLFTEYFHNVKVASRTWRKFCPLICFG